MPRFRKGRVDSITGTRDGIQHVTVDTEPAYVLTQIIGPVQVGDAVVVNTTAVDLGLGTGGHHVVHWNLSRSSVDLPGTGHIMKARYLSEQLDIGAWEETEEARTAYPGGRLPDIGDVTVVGCLLHSQVVALAIAIAFAAPKSRVAFVMADWASLPLALSDVIDGLTSRGLVDLTITTGHAFGGDVEAVSVASGLLAAQHHEIDIAIVGPGPGHAGTASALGFSALDLVGVLDMAGGLGARVACLPRWSSTDLRERHRGLSHHSRAIMTLLARPAVVAVPPGKVGEGLRRFVEQVGSIVKIEEYGPVDVRTAFAVHELTVSSMGRDLSQDRDALDLIGATARWSIATLAGS